MSWQHALDDLEEATRLARSGKGNQALHAVERAIHHYGAELLGISVTEFKARLREDRQPAELLRSEGLITSEARELLDGFRIVRNAVAHPPFHFELDGKSVLGGIEKLRKLIQKDEAPLHTVAVRDLYAVDPGTSAVEVAATMARRDYSFVPVLDGSSPVGTVTERAVVELFEDAGSDASYLDRKVSDIMKEPLPVRQPSETVHGVVPEVLRNGAILVPLRDGWGIFTIWDYTHLAVQAG